MDIKEVITQADGRAFIEFPVSLYRNAAHWIRPLDKDVNTVFDPVANPTYEFGKCVRYLLYDDSKVIGRIAVFINERTAHKNDQPTGGIGFFDCINSQEAANILFDRAKSWLMERGMEAMDGPINFGERDKWWGCLVDGFDIDPNYQCNYNFPYYQDLFEKYGFQVYFKQFTFIRNTFEPFHPRIQEKSNILHADPNYSFEYMRLKQLMKYAEDFRIIYNKAWTNHEGVAEMTKEQSKSIMTQMRPILDEKIIWFAYYKNEPVAFYVNLPEVNQLFKFVNGKLDMIGKLKFLWHRWRRTNKKMLGLVFGVVPEHQGKGLDGALVMAVAKMVQQDYKRYPILEMNWIGDFNRRMITVVKQVGGEIGKTHHTYRYLFDRSKPFERMPIK